MTVRAEPTPGKTQAFIFCEVRGERGEPAGVR